MHVFAVRALPNSVPSGEHTSKFEVLKKWIPRFHEQVFVRAVQAAEDEVVAADSDNNKGNDDDDDEEGELVDRTFSSHIPDKYERVNFRNRTGVRGPLSTCAYVREGTRDRERDKQTKGDR